MLASLSNTNCPQGPSLPGLRSQPGAWLPARGLASAVGFSKHDSEWVGPEDICYRVPDTE